MIGDLLHEIGGGQLDGIPTEELLGGVEHVPRGDVFVDFFQEIAWLHVAEIRPAAGIGGRRSHARRRAQR